MQEEEETDISGPNPVIFAGTHAPLHFLTHKSSTNLDAFGLTVAIQACICKLHHCFGHFRDVDSKSSLKNKKDSALHLHTAGIQPMSQCTHKAIIILFIMKLDIEFLVLSFSADDEKYKVRDGLTVVMKWVVIHGCFLCLSVLYCQGRGHPSLALHHLQNVSLLFAIHLCWPQIGC